MAMTSSSFGALCAALLSPGNMDQVVQGAFRGGLTALEEAGFEVVAIEALVRLHDEADSSPRALTRLAVLHDPGTDNHVQLCTRLSLSQVSDRLVDVWLQLQLHALEEPAPEYDTPKAVLVEFSLLRVRLEAPTGGRPPEREAQLMVTALLNGEASDVWAGVETQERFKQVFEDALRP